MIHCRDSKNAARDSVAAGEIGRFHEKPVGPHPMWSYQILFPMPLFPDVAGWLALNRDGLDVFLHPNTGNDLADHRDHAMWIGRSYELDLSIFKK